MTEYDMYPNTFIYANGHLIELGEWSGSYNPTTGESRASYPLRIDSGAWNAINNTTGRVVSVPGVTVTYIGGDVVSHQVRFNIEATPIAASTTTPEAAAAINAAKAAAIAAAIESAAADYAAGNISSEQYSTVVSSLQRAATIARTGGVSGSPKSDSTGTLLLLGLGVLALMMFMKGKK